MARRSSKSKLAESSEPIEFIVGSAKLRLEPNGQITIEGTDIAIKASGTLSMQAGGKVVVKAPKNIAIIGSKLESN